MGRLAMGAVALAAAIGLAGCGESDRDRVGSYVEEANSIQKRSEREFKRANRFYAAILAGKAKPEKLVAETERSEESIERARARLAAVEPVAPARRLHRRLLVLFDRNLELARETTTLARYQRDAELAVKPLSRSTRTIAGLSELPTAGEQAEAMRRYADSVAAGLRRLRKLTPPPVLRPAHRDLMRRLGATRRTSAALAGALGSANEVAVAQLVIDLRDATAARPRRGVLAGSIKAYESRYREISKASAAVQREHARLDDEL